MKTVKDVLANPTTTIIDVRNDWEFESGHIEGALNIPVNEIPNHLEKIKTFQGPLVVYCQSGGRSGMAQQYLQQQGLAEVYNGGGIGQMRMLV
jgi:phage shock protein E